MSSKGIVSTNMRPASEYIKFLKEDEREQKIPQPNILQN